MARRRLQAILATTVITVGLSSGAALAQEIPGLTDSLEETTTSTTEAVASTVDDVVDTLTGGDAATAEPTEASTSESTTTEQASEESTPGETATDDEPLVDVGTGDGTLDVELDVDVAPSDEDGSLQFEVGGGITIGGKHVDVGGLTDPIEEVIDPDPEPEPSGDTSSDQTSTRRHEGSGGVFAGGGVVAAGDDTRPASTGTSSPASSRGQGFSTFGNGSNFSFGVQDFGGGTMDVDRVADPEVAPPDTAPDDAAAFDEFPETPEVAEGSTPAVLATETPMGGDSPLANALRALAGALVLATGAAWTRTTRDA